MFKLTVKKIDVETGGMPVISLNEEFTKANDISPMDRVLIKTSKGRVLVAAVDTSEELIQPSEIGFFEDVWKRLKSNNGDLVTVTPVLKPESVKYIRKKMDKEELFDEEIHAIVKDIVDDRLLDVEMASFVSAAYMEGLSISETSALTKSIVETGGRLKLKKKRVLDKHCIGGVPGNRTTMIVVPIIASLGLMIPKTSSRSITSPAGTADTMETLACVSFSISELTEIVKKTKGCIVWGGAINLAAADDKLIRVRHPLSLDPEGMMLASIMAKKIAVGATHVVFDLPVGAQAKLQYLGEARHLQREFRKLGEKFKLNIDTVITDGNEPIGNGIGPNLEARDVLKVLNNSKDKLFLLCPCRAKKL
jgi:AMP phosphorylase